MAAGPAFATVVGQRPSQWASHQVFGDVVATGNSLMVPTAGDEEVNTVLLGSSQGFISGLPCDAQLEGAYLFWTGSTAAAPDTTADLTAPTGVNFNDISGDCLTIPRSRMGGFFYCRADVTAQLAPQTTGCGYNGMYTVGDVTAMVGDYNSPDPYNGPCFAQAKYAAWSLVLVYSEPEGLVRRDIVVYDGFLNLDEDTYNPSCNMDNPTGGQDAFTIGGFQVGNPARGKLMLFALEGDDQLGVPPQDSDPVTPCATCEDYLAFNGTRLWDAFVTPGNLFNASAHFSGVDLDVFDIGETGFDLLTPGQTSATIEVGSGDGIVCDPNVDPNCSPDPGGGGESFILGWLVVSLETLSANFGANSRLWFDRPSASAGERAWLTIRIQNDGNLDATNVRVTNALPAGLSYVAGTTSVDGAGVSDVGGLSPLHTPAGLSLGTIRWQGDRDREVRLQVQVDADQVDGTRLCSTATITADNLQTFTTPPTDPCLQVEAASIGQPLLAVTDVNGQPTLPGDRLRYRVTLPNNGDQAATGLTFVADLPPYVRDLSVISIPSGADDQSSPVGGVNGTGRIDVRDIVIPSDARYDVEILFEVTIFTGAELIGAGVPSDGIDGLALTMQGSLDAAWLDPALLSDDPAVPGSTPPDPTTVVLTYRPSLGASTKTGLDVNGGRTEPGDVLRYTFDLVNDGTQPATVSLTDDLPPGVEACTVISAPPGASVQCVPPPAGAFSNGQLTASGITVAPEGGSVQVVFEVVVAADATHGLSIVNSALMEVAERPEENRTLTAAGFTVYNTPEFGLAAKSVVDQNGAPAEPGDQLTFTLRYRNDGNRPATATVVTDAVDPNLTGVTPGQGGVFDGTSITWTLGDVAPGEEVVLTFDARLAAPLDGGTVITNQGRLEALELAGPVLTNTVTITVTADPALSTFSKAVAVTDVDGDGQVSPGDRVDYTLTLRNTGNAVARNLVVTDPVPTELTGIAVGQGGGFDGATITWNIGDLDLYPPTEQVLTFTGTIVSPLENGTVISNQAIASATGIADLPSDDPATPAPADPTVITIVSQAALSAAKAWVDDDGGDPMPGDTLSWTITLTSTGNAPATDQTVVDSLPAELINPVAAEGGQVVGNTITWSPATTPGLARITDTLELHFTAELARPQPDGTVVCNQAQAAGGLPPGPVVAGPSCLTVVSAPRLTESTKVAVDLDADGIWNPGDRVRYELTITNTGTETATAVTVTDPLAAELTDVVVGQGGSFAAGVVSWPPIASLAPDEQALLTFEATIVLPLPDGTQIANQGAITSAELPGPSLTDDPGTPAPGDPTIITVASAPDLTGAWTKTVEDLTGDPGVTEPGDLLRYTLTLANTGTAVADDVTVSDPVPVAHLTNVTPGQGGLFDGSTITWGSAQVPALASLSPLDPPVSLSFEAEVIVPTQNGTRIENQALATHAGDPVGAPSDDPLVGGDADPTVVVVVSGSNLTSSSKIAYDADANSELAPGATVVPGQRVRYELTIANTGNDSARSVVVRDPVDASLEVESIGQGGRLVGAEIRWSDTPELAVILPDSSVVLTFVVRLRVPLPNGTPVANQGFAMADDLAAEQATDDARTPEVDDPVLLVVSSAPDLADFTKQVEDLNGGDFRPGDQVRYALTVRNTGDAMATNALVTDAIDVALLEDVQPGQGGSFDGSAVVWPALDVGLSPAGDEVLTFTARIRSPLDDGTLVSDQASLSADDLPGPILSDDPGTPAPDDPTVFALVAAPDLGGLTKAVIDQNGDPPGPGDTLLYTITVTNEGDMLARDVVVSDPIDGVNLIDVTPLDGGVLSAGNLSWTSAGTPALAQVAPGDQIPLRFTARIRPLTPGGTTILNQAQASAQDLPGPAPSDDPATPDPDDPTRVVVVAAPDFSTTTKEGVDQNGPPLLPGDPVAYAITVRNTGNTFATGVVVSDPLDANLTDVQPGQGGQLQADRITWDQTAVAGLARLDPGDEVLLTFTARVADGVVDGTAISNQALLTSVELPDSTGSDDPATPDAAGDPTVLVVQTPVLDTASKTIEDLNGAPFEPGDQIRYLIEVPNTGSAAATNLAVSDPVDLLNLIDIQPEAGGVLANGTITWTPGDLPADQAVRLGFTARIRPMTAGGTQVSNQASITAGELADPLLSDDPTTPAADDPTRFTVEASPDLSAATKAVEDLDGGVVAPGDGLRYTIVVRNTGNTWADEVAVIDPVPPELDQIQPDQGGLFDGVTLTWNSATTPALRRVGLSPDEDVVLSFLARVRPDTPDGTRISNQAVVQAAGAQPAPTDDPATPDSDDPTRVTVVAAPLFTGSTKSVQDLDGGLVEPGDTLEFTLGVINSGHVAATNSLVRDAVPARTTYVAGSTTLNGLAVADGPGGVSPLVDGMPIRSARAGTPDGTVLVDDGSGASDAVAVVTFRVRVSSGGGACGATVANRAWIWSDATDPVGTNPVEVTVGNCPNLNQTVKGWYLAEDLGTQGLVEPGDTLAFTVDVTNTGPTAATGVVFTDPIPANTTYTAGSLSLDGLGLSDAADADAGEVVAGLVTVRLGELAPGGQARIAFRTRVESGPRVVNQGLVVSDQLADEPTDDDGDEANGDNPTVVPVGDTPHADLTTSRKAVEDLDGGTALPGDVLRYTIQVINAGSAEAVQVQVVDAVPAGTVFVPGSLERDGQPLTDAADADAGTWSAAAQAVTFQLARLEAGAESQLAFQVRIDPQTPLGSLVDNLGRISAEGVDPFDTNLVRLVVGGSPGTGGVRGRVFAEIGARNRTWDVDRDQALEGYRVELRLADQPDGAALATATAAADGTYALMDLQPGEYSLRAISTTGVRFTTAALTGEQAIAADRVDDRDLPVDPSGRLYDSSSGRLLAGSVVSIYYDDEDPQFPGQKVPAADMPAPSQQDQITDRFGMYRFDLQTGHRYRIGLTPPSPAWVFPSARIVPQTGFAGDLLDGGLVVPNELPDPDGDTRYFLRFDLGEPVFNNHVPLDRLDGLLRLSKQVDKRVASVGDILTYTVQLANGSGQDLDSDGVSTGVWIHDRAPDGFAFLQGVNAAELLAPDGRVLTLGADQLPSAKEARGRLLRFGPYTLPAGHTLRVRYRMALGSDVQFGEQENRAQAFIGGNVLASNEAVARVRVVADPIFDQALVIGKVFCDTDGDGYQNAGTLGERGVPGARIYVDTGWYAETDPTGKYHLKGIAPGLHLFKLDPDSLPPGSQVRGRAAETLHLTRGLPAKLNFPVRCAERELTAEARPVESGAQGLQTVELVGDTDSFWLRFQGRPVALPPLRLWVSDPDGSPLDEVAAYKRGDRKQAPELVFGSQGPEDELAARWSLEIIGPEGNLVGQQSGAGGPPERLEWDSAGRPVEKGNYRAVLRVTMKDGTEVQAAPVALGLGIPAGQVDTAIYPASLSVDGARIPIGDEVDQATAGFSLSVPVGDNPAVKVAFTEANGRTVTARLAVVAPPSQQALALTSQADGSLTLGERRLVKPLSGLDVALKLPAGASGLPLDDDGGLAQPAVFAVLGNPAGVLTWNLNIHDSTGQVIHMLSGAGPPPEALPWDGRDDRDKPVLSPGWYTYRLAVEHESGARLKTAPRPFAVLDAGTQEEWQSDDLFLRARRLKPSRRLRARLDQLARRLEAAGAGRATIQIHTDDKGGAVRAQKRTQAQAAVVHALLTERGLGPARVAVEALGSRQPKVPNTAERNRARNRRLVVSTPPVLPSGRPERSPAEPSLRVDGEVVAGGRTGTPLKLERDPGQEIQLAWDDPGGRQVILPVKVSGPGQAPLSDTPQRSGVKLRAWLPPEAAQVRSERIWIRGQTDPTNKLTVNGQPAQVGPDGAFLYELKVAADMDAIEIVATAPDGRQASLRSAIAVQPNTWFLMALADTAVAEVEAGQQLDGVTKRTSTVIKDTVLLHGRAMVYLKARVKGKVLFDQYRFTAHFDTAKGDDEAFLEQIIDPERYYPVYGDSSSEVQDVRARRKLFVLIEADDSKLTVGNFRTGLKGIDVLRYDRTLYGGQLVFKKVLGGDWDTEVRAHGADDSEQVSHAHVQLTPTGGSLYYLPHTFLLEGSEQVRLVVRDRDSGLILMSMPKQRDVDYTIRYREGRIIFHTPIASTVDAGLSASANLQQPADGHPVSIEVDYEHEGGRGPGEWAWGVSAHEAWRDTVRVGGSYVQEGRKGADYRLWGVDLSLKDPAHPSTYLKGEFARSENTDADNFLSTDGGLSFTPLGAQTEGRPIEGNAYKVTAGIEIAPYLDRKDPLLDLSGYFQQIDPGYYANGILIEQGQRKAGGRVGWHPIKAGLLQLRHDGAWSDLFLQGERRELTRHVSRLSYKHDLAELELLAEVIHTMVSDSLLADELQHGDALAAAARYRFSERWSAFIRQEALVYGQKELIDSFGDRMRTTVGASLKLTDDLELTLSEAVRWSGENATAFGLSTKLGEKARFYTNERFQYAGGRYLSTTVVGAKDQPLDGVTTYGEYQLLGASAGTQNRAVLGLSNHFTWGKGWSLDVNYERTQTFGDSGFGPALPPGGQAAPTGTVPLPDGVTGGTGFEGAPSTALPGMNAYGSFLAGEASRDAIGVGLSYKGLESLRLALGFEFRYDNADDDLITAGGIDGIAYTPRTGVKDRMQFLVRAGAAWKWTEDLSFSVSLRFADTEALETTRDGVTWVEGGTEARFLDGSAGLAFRPVDYDWVALIAKYSKRIERRPLDLTSGTFEESDSDVLTVMPIFEIPLLRLQIAEKVAWKHARERAAGLPDASGHTLLWINRLNVRIIEDLYIGGEYRMLRSWLAEDRKQGFLAEIAYVLADAVRLGVGYNFTSFSDDLLDRNDYDAGGFFFRAIGQY